MSDLKEQLQDAIQCCYDTDGFGVDFENGDNESGILLGDALAAVEDVADSYTGWISVDERLPEVGAVVDVWMKKKRFAGNRFTNMRWMKSLGQFRSERTQQHYNLEQMSHWMPQPLPPCK